MATSYDTAASHGKEPLLPTSSSPRGFGSKTSCVLRPLFSGPEKDRLWLKEQSAGGRKVHVAYSKDNRLIVSSASSTEGVNFTTVAKTPGDVADVLLMTLTFGGQKAKGEK
jgi:hypothetical protein